MTKKKRPVILTTEYKGVFFGWTKDEFNFDKMTLSDCQMCVKWDSAPRGLNGLAVSGPNNSCVISPAAPEMTLVKITAEIKCSKEAVISWEKYK